MDSALYPDRTYVPATARVSVKILVVGHFAVGKTTFIGSLSEITPLRTEALMTQASTGVDDLAGVRDKDTTTVAMDFGRLTLNPRLVLYLFGVPGQHRFTPMWHDLAEGAVGALVLADTRRLDLSFPVMDLLEEEGLRYAVALNHFDGAAIFDDADIRTALLLAPSTPMVTCDARDQSSARDALIALVNYLLTASTTGEERA